MPQAACAAQLGTSFSACAGFAGLDYPFEFYWTFDSATRALTGAIVGSSPTGWFSVGFPSPSSPGRMSNSNCVIVRSDSTASSGEREF